MSQSRARALLPPRRTAPLCGLVSRPALPRTTHPVPTAASALRKLGRNDEATARFERAAEACPLDPSIHYKLGHHLRSMGSLEGAAEAYRRVTELDPGNEVAAFWLTASRRPAGPGKSFG